MPGRLPDIMEDLKVSPKVKLPHRMHGLTQRSTRKGAPRQLLNRSALICWTCRGCQLHDVEQSCGKTYLSNVPG